MGSCQLLLNSCLSLPRQSLEGLGIKLTWVQASFLPFATYKANITGLYFKHLFRYVNNGNGLALIVQPALSSIRGAQYF